MLIKMDITKPNCRKKKNSNGGFTLIELMIAMAIMAFGVLGYTFLQSRSLQNRVFSREMNRATIIAQDFTEQLMALPYNHSLLDADTSGNPTTHPLSGSGVTKDGQQWIVTTEGNFRYYTRWVVTAGIPDTNVKLIELFTVWEKKSPDDGTISLGGYKKRDGSINHQLAIRSFMRDH